MSEPTEAWVEGERRRAKTTGRLTGAVVLLALAVAWGANALSGVGDSNRDLTTVVVAQRERLTDLAEQNDELAAVLNGRTPIIAHIDEAATRIECLIEKQSIVLVTIVIAVVRDDPAAVQAVLKANEELQAAIDGPCRPDRGGDP